MTKYKQHAITTAVSIVLAILCPLVVSAQVPVSLSPVPHMQFLNNSGLPLASGCVFTYQAGTTNPAATYVDSLGVSTNTNPIILNAGGFADIWLPNAAFKFTVKSSGGVNCASGATLWTVDNITGVLGLLNLNNVWTGTNSFSQQVAITTNTNQIALGTPGNQVTLNAPAPASNVTLTFPSTADTLVGRATTDTLTNKTLTSPTMTTPTITNPVIGGVLMQTPASYSLYPNETVTGTVTSKLVKLTGAGASAILPTTGDTGGVVGIAVSGAGNGVGTNVTVEQTGGGTGCIFDGATTANDYVQISATVAGDCHDAGAAFPTNGQVIGRALSTGGGAGSLISVLLFPPEIRPAGGAFPGCTAIGPVTVSNTVALSTLLSCSIPANTLSAGSLLAVDLTGIESTASGQTISFTYTLGGGTPCTTSPATLSVANNQPIYTLGKFAVLTAGAGGTANWSCGFLAFAGSFGPTGTVGAPTISINTTISNTLLLQVTMSVANAGNTTTAQLLKSVVF